MKTTLQIIAQLLVAVNITKTQSRRILLPPSTLRVPNLHRNAAPDAC
jgi:hypothetical protein